MSLAPLLLLALSLGDGPQRAALRLPPPAPAAPTPAARPLAEVEAEVRGLLGAIDTPIPAARWRALGAQARGALEALSLDGAALPTRRARAVDALAALASEAEAPRFLGLALDEAAPFVVRLAAVRAVGAAVPRENLEAALRPALETARDGRVRAAAARVLAERTPRACPALALRVKQEAPDAREAFEPAARACGWDEASWR
jgi:hypothetical protein